MIVTCSAHASQVRISDHETLLSIRVDGESEASYLSELLSGADSVDIAIEEEAA